MLGSLLSRRGRQQRREGTETVGERGCSLCGGVKGLARQSADIEREPECEFHDIERFYSHFLTSPEQGDESCRARAHPTDCIRWAAA